MHKAWRATLKYDVDCAYQVEEQFNLLLSLLLRRYWGDASIKDRWKSATLICIFIDHVALVKQGDMALGSIRLSISVRSHGSTV